MSKKINATTILTKEEMNEYHYVYRITNIKLNKHYYGSRTGKGFRYGFTLLDDLKHYQSSSHDKHFKQHQKDNIHEYKYKIIKISKDKNECLDLEITLHNKFNVAINTNFYNKSKQTVRGFNTSGTRLSKEHKEKIKNALNNKTDEEKLERSNKQKNYVKSRTIEQENQRKLKEKITKSNKTKEENEITSMKMKSAIANRCPKVEARRKQKAKETNNGKSKEEIDKINKARSIANSNKPPRAKIFVIYDNNDNIVNTIHGDLKGVCELYNYPYGALRRSLKENNKLYQTSKGIMMAKKSGNIKFQGWYLVDKGLIN